jgi:hypothetical protein
MGAGRDFLDDDRRKGGGDGEAVRVNDGEAGDGAETEAAVAATEAGGMIAAGAFEAGEAVPGAEGKDVEEGGFAAGDGVERS